MSKEYSFNVMPSVSISRSRFARNSQHKTTFKLGDLIPIYCDEVLPGDTRSIDIASLVRMSTPIAPIMDNIYLDIFAFFIPNRIVWDHWKEFMGENSVSAGIPSSTYSIPVVTTNTGNSFAVGSLGDYFGLPVSVNGIAATISALPFRCYVSVYNRWFRDENLIAPVPLRTDDNAGAILGYDVVNQVPLKVAKLPDYFTKSLPYAQKGTAVSIPLGSLAPIVTTNVTHLNTSGLGSGTGRFMYTDSLGVTLGSGNMYFSNSTGAEVDVGSSSTGTLTNIYGNNMYADLSSVTAATINQLRYAFQLQKFLEKDALYGSRYWEILAAHFGVQSPDATLQDPEYLGGSRVNINIDQVLATAAGSNGAGSPSTSVLGQPGANSVTAHKGSLFTKSFVEHGHILIVACARHDLTYTQGVNRMWSRKTRYDFYWPVFANLGAQEVKNKEIYAQGNSTDDLPFGYQEAWAEYRYKPSIASGLMRPGVSGNLGFWTLSENFAALPTLGQTFIEQGRGNLSRALTTGVTGPDFIADFYFRDIAVRPMPTYSIPGLIDHH